MIPNVLFPFTWHAPQDTVITLFHVERFTNRNLPIGRSQSMAKKPNRLGRGLNSLISSSLLDDSLVPTESPTVSPTLTPPSSEPRKIDITPDSAPSSASRIVGRLAALEAQHSNIAETADLANAVDGSIILQIPVDSITPNANQPRRAFDPVSIGRLARSVTESGILQPLLVRAVARTNQSYSHAEYELIAGERRLRAAKAAGMDTVPAILKSIDSKTSMELALVENIQREDLNAMDRARAYRAFCDRTGYSAEDASRRLGEDRSTVANYLRLLDLAEPVAKMVESGQLSMGHARALLGQPDTEIQTDLAKQALAGGLSVRAIESLVKSRRQPPREPATRLPSASTKASHLAHIEEKLQQAAKTKVVIKPGRGAHRGKIVIDYYSLDDFDRIAALLGYSDRDAH
jgi:ParB family chromosome partitioning protein